MALRPDRSNGRQAKLMDRDLKERVFNLLCNASPIAWVEFHDRDEAEAWERQAAKIIAEMAREDKQ